MRLVGGGGGVQTHRPICLRLWRYTRPVFLRLLLSGPRRLTEKPQKKKKFNFFGVLRSPISAKRCPQKRLGSAAVLHDCSAVWIHWRMLHFRVEVPAKLGSRQNAKKPCSQWTEMDTKSTPPKNFKEQWLMIWRLKSGLLILLLVRIKRDQYGPKYRDFYAEAWGLPARRIARSLNEIRLSLYGCLERSRNLTTAPAMFHVAVRQVQSAHNERTSSSCLALCPQQRVASRRTVGADLEISPQDGSIHVVSSSN